VEHLDRAVHIDAESAGLRDPFNQPPQNRITFTHSRRPIVGSRIAIEERVDARIREPELDMKVPAAAQIVHRIRLARSRSLHLQVVLEAATCRSVQQSPHVAEVAVDRRRLYARCGADRAGRYRVSPAGSE
jgi:hypothetical protein